MDTQVTNYGMDSDPASKSEAERLCADAVNYIGNTCVNGIGGTSGAGPCPKFQHKALRDGSIVWNDNTGKKMIGFSFTQKPN